MLNQIAVPAVIVALVWTIPSIALAQSWNFPGLNPEAFEAVPAGGSPAVRDLTGLWDAGRAGIGGQGQAAARDAARASFTPLGEEMVLLNKPGNGPREASIAENNDPLNTVGDPSGFPRNVNYEFRPVQIVQTPDQVLMLYAFNRRWRVIWTDGRALPEDPDPRWFGYSIGRWEDDHTFVVDTVGLTDRGKPAKVGVPMFIRNNITAASNAAACLMPMWPRKKTAAPSRIPRSLNEIGASVLRKKVELAAGRIDTMGPLSKVRMRNRN